MRLDPALVVALGLALGGAMSQAPGPCALGIVAVVLLFGRRITAATLLCATVALGAGTWRARHAVNDFETRRLQTRDVIQGPRRCAGAGVVASSPTWRRGMANLELELGELDCEGRHLPAPLRVRVYGGPSDLRRGDRVSIVADLAPVELYHNLDLPDPTPLAARRGLVLSGGSVSVELAGRGWGVGAWIDAARAHTRDRILRTFAPQAEPLARALVIGENDLDPDDDTAFKLSGLAHLLAVSGTHLVLAVVGLVEVLRMLLVRWTRVAMCHDVGRWAAAFGGVLALLYADFAGGSGSAWRAAWMLTAAFTARALGRHAPVSRCFAWALAVGATGDPLLVFDASFLLSAAATAGLVLLGPAARALCARFEFAPLRWLVSSVVTTLSAMLPCIPLLALLSPSVTGAGVLANVIAGPLGETIALPLCLLHTLLAWAPALERGVALVASGALLVVRELALSGSRARWLAFSVPPPGAWEMTILLVSAAGAVLVALRPVGSALGRWLSATAILGGALACQIALERAVRSASRPHDQLVVTAVDVGQGDATLLDMPDGTLMLVDGGGSVGGADPGKLVLLPLLRQRQRALIDIAVLTHAHPDHLVGLATVLESVAVRELWMPWDPAHTPQDPLLRRLLRTLSQRGVAVRSASQLCRESPVFGGARARVLAPCSPSPALDSGNNGSLVMKITLGERSVLLAGDAEAARERDLVEQLGANLRADLLKVGHHGSKTSTTPRWLDVVAPRWATIACGVRNPHGHPYPDTVERLVQHGVRVLRLDRHGSVRWSTDGRGVSLSAYSLEGR